MIKALHGAYTVSSEGKDSGRTRITSAELRTADGHDWAILIAAESIEIVDQPGLPAELARDAALEALRKTGGGTPSTAPVDAIKAAFAAANTAVYEKGRFSQSRLTCALDIALVVDGDSLYIGHLGTGRIALFSGVDGVTPLTIEHTFANVMIQSGQMSAEQAYASPRAAALMRGIGINDEAEPDIGLYHQTADYETAQKRGLAGYPLRIGEAVLVTTSEGYQVSQVTQEPMFTEAELIRTLESAAGEEAARTLGEFVPPRQPQKDIALGVISLPDPRRAATARRSKNGALLWVATLATLFAFGALVIFPTITATLDNAPFMTETAQARTVVAAANREATLTATYRPPTPTAVMVLAQDEVGLFRPNNEDRDVDIQRVRLNNGFIASGGVPWMARINTASGTIADAFFFLGRDTSVMIQDIEAGGRSAIAARMVSRGHLFMESGGYTDGLRLVLPGESFANVSVSGSCMSVINVGEETGDTRMRAACYEGNCTYQLGDPVGDSTPVPINIPVGFEVTFSYNPPIVSEPLPISQTTRQQDYRILRGSAAGRAVAAACYGALIDTVITATPTPTTTATATDSITPSATATETGTQTITRTPTRTRDPNATARPSATRTATPEITSTVTASPLPTNRPLPGEEIVCTGNFQRQGNNCVCPSPFVQVGISCQAQVTCSAANSIRNPATNTCVCQFTGTFPNCQPQAVVCDAPNSSRDAGTNTCVCDHGGSYPSCNPPPVVCDAPNSSRDVESNTCVCDHGGSYPSCNPPPVVCDAPNSTRDVESNTCVCDHGGSYPSCNPPPVVCDAPNSSRDAGTNTCVCNHGGSYPSCNPPPPTCGPGYVIENNACVCPPPKVEDGGSCIDLPVGEGSVGNDDPPPSDIIDEGSDPSPESSPESPNPKRATTRHPALAASFPASFIETDDGRGR
ncbi:MAG: hypothetical protein SF162_09060 [bacterium]|nr:hypothetical protein [bacterium]